MPDQRPISPLFDLSGKVAIVTGGAQGIGRGLALGLAAHGAAVVVADIARQRAEEAAEAIAEAGGNALPIRSDVTHPSDVDVLVDTTVRRFGTVDILVNNVGGVGPGEGPP